MLEIKYKKINEINPYENNPRCNDEAVDFVANSIKEFGFKVPIIVDGNNIIVAGHTRYKASLKLGLEEVPCIVADDLSEEQIKAFRLADNKTSEIATWDEALLEKELADLTGLFDMGDFGFELLEDDNSIDEVTEDGYDVQENIPEEPKTKPGDIYKLGNHRLMCGDSTDIETVKKLMDNQLADMLLTDLPYNVNIEGTNGMKIENDNMDSDSFRNFLYRAFNCANEVMKKGASFYIWHGESESFNFRGACVDVGWLIKQCLIWNKNNMVLGRQDYQWKHEPCLYGWKDGASHLWASDRKQTTVIDFNKPQRNGEHPTMKPVGLFDYLIKNNTKPGDVVLDLFMGSGTTIMACEQNGRIAYGMELDPKYVDVIINRWETFTGKKAELLNDSSSN